MTYNATDDEFAAFMCGALSLLQAHGLAVRAVPIPFTAAPPAATRQGDSPVAGAAPTSVATATSPAAALLPAVGASYNSEDV